MAEEMLNIRSSMVMRAAREGSVATEAWTKIFCLTWRPLYAYARRFGNNPEVAEVNVRGFLASLVMKSYLEDAPSAALKLPWPLETPDAEEQFLKNTQPKDSPDAAFDRMWALGLLAQAKAKLRSECLGAGKTKVFISLFPDDGSKPEAINAELAVKLKMNEQTMKALAIKLRKRWGELIRAEISDFIIAKDSLEEELLSLRSALVM
jgi:hypothetical protein